MWTWGAGLLVLLSKGKFLLGLLKLKPLLSALITVGVYALIYPWTFAVGFVALIFIHELGHIWAARRRGLHVTAPFFIPFVGSMVMLKRQPKDAANEASIALAGPLFGSAAALVCFGVWKWTDGEVWLALAYIGFFLNLLNLLPMQPLDGSRIVAAVSRWLWLVGVVAGPFIIWYTHSILFLLIWIWFLWQMYRRFFGADSRAKRYAVEGVYQAYADPLLPAWYLSGQSHRRDLPYTAYCRMDGQHVVEFRWEPLNFRGELEIDQPCVIRNVSIVQSSEPNEENLVLLRVRAELEPYEPSNFYEVPVRTRVKFGILYGGLAVALFAMMGYIHQLGALER